MIDLDKPALLLRERPWPAWPTTAAALLVATILSAFVGLTAQPVYDAIRTVLGVTNEVLGGLLFASYLLLLGGVVVMWRPKSFGVQFGSAMKEWRAIGAVIAGFVSVVAFVLSQMPTTPYSGSDWIFEVIAVPVSEELFFRGVLITGLVWLLGRAHSRRRATSLAVMIGGLAFGLAHLSNLAIAPASFVVPQALFAVILGIGAGYLRVVTESIYPAILLHAAVNLVVVLI
jgi:membrane protease YdiL (CAAX protease family)